MTIPASETGPADKLRPTLRAKLDDVMERLKSKMDSITDDPEETKRIANKITPKGTKMAFQVFKEEDLND